MMMMLVMMMMVVVMMMMMIPMIMIMTFMGVQAREKVGVQASENRGVQASGRPSTAYLALVPSIHCFMPMHTCHENQKATTEKTVPGLSISNRLELDSPNSAMAYMSLR